MFVRSAARVAASRSRARGLATVADAPFKIVSVDGASPATASVTLLLKAGSRYETAPGVAHVLKNFGFKGTSERSPLKTVRETELYGGVLSASHGREYISFTADFLKGDEEYFVDLLSGVLTSTTFATHELHEMVAPLVEAEALAAHHDPAALALDVAHNVAFRHGLGNPLFAASPVPRDAVASFAKAAFTKDSIAVISSGIEESKLSSLLQKAVGSLPSSAGTPSSKTTYFGGESRVTVAHTTPTLFVGFGTAEPSAALSVLAAHLDPSPSLKWTEGTSPLSKLASEGVSAKVINEVYSDGALFGVLLQSSDAAAIKKAGAAVVAALKSGSSLEGDALKKAVAKAKFAAASALESGRDASAALLAPQVFGSKSFSVESTLKSIDGVSSSDLSKITKGFLGSKSTVVAVGDVALLPYADEIGL